MIIYTDGKSYRAVEGKITVTIPIIKDDYVNILRKEIDKARRDMEEMSKLSVDNWVMDDYSKWQLIREKRNQLLAESDWTQLPDVGIDEKQREAWREYRQALRDIPQDYTNPDAVVWPTKPS